MPVFNAGQTANYPSLWNQLGSKNVIINGGFTINQRAYVSAAVLASGAFGHDRWKAGASGGDYSFTQLASNTTITIASGKTLIQVIEDKFVVGGTYVLSWTGTAQARYAINSATPAGSYAASPIVIAGQTAGTTMSVEFNTGTLGNVMLEVGVVVGSNFEWRSYQAEFALCQRYLPAFNSTGTTSHVGNGHASSATVTELTYHFQVPPRIPPTGITVSAASHFRVTDGVANTTLSALAFASVISREAAILTGTVAAGLTQYRPYYCYAINASGQILFTGCEL